MNDSQHSARPVTSQRREHATTCWPCGLDPNGRPTETWNPSGLCTPHEIMYGAVDAREAARLRADAIWALMRQGYGEQTARQTVDKISGFPAQRAGAR
jgi:hypothetical protein